MQQETKEKIKYKLSEAAKGIGYATAGLGAGYFLWNFTEKAYRIRSTELESLSLSKSFLKSALLDNSHLTNQNFSELYINVRGVLDKSDIYLNSSLENSLDRLNLASKFYNENNPSHESMAREIILYTKENFDKEFSKKPDLGLPEVSLLTTIGFSGFLLTKAIKKFYKTAFNSKK